MCIRDRAVSGRNSADLTSPVGENLATGPTDPDKHSTSGDLAVLRYYLRGRRSSGRNSAGSSLSRGESLCYLSDRFSDRQSTSGDFGSTQANSTIIHNLGSTRVKSEVNLQISSLPWAGYIVPATVLVGARTCLLYTSPSPRDS